MPIIIPLLLTTWCLSAYVLQPFPANGIAGGIILAIAFNAFRNPASGLLTAVFLTPLTLSLGHHLQVYLKDWAPPYLPYAEIILLATLLGWVVRDLLNRLNPDRFAIEDKDPTPIEHLFLWVMGLWAALALLGIAPALYRNLATSPALPFNLLAVKIAFAPVWGPGDEFYPLTAAINIMLAFCFLHAVQRLIRQDDLYPALRRVFLTAIALTALYAIVQFVFEIGYTKGRFAYYNLSTFQENESFATFNFLAFVLALPLFFHHEESRYKALSGLACLLYLSAVLLSNSRAILVLLLAALFLAALWLAVRDPRFYLRKKAEVLLCALLLPALAGAVAYASPYTWNKAVRLANDVLVARSIPLEDHKPLDRDDLKEARELGGNLTFYTRAKLWRSALQMWADTAGVGVGAGAYYRLTGFPKYQALYKMENAHWFWLQLLAEYGLLALFIALTFLLLPVLLLSRPGARRGWALALLAFWFCNCAGQSLTQREILWLIAALAGAVFVGALPARWDAWRPTRPAAVFGLTLLLLLQAAAWSLTTRPEGMGYPKIASETYGWAFDENGHRYLKVGGMVSEERYPPTDDVTLEYRVRSDLPDVSASRPQTVTANLLDDFSRILASAQVELTEPGQIHSLFLPIQNQAGNKVAVVLTTDRVSVDGELTKSTAREIRGFRYHGHKYRFPGEKPEPKIEIPKNIPHTTWDYRTQYENEGQFAFFSDCGLYKNGGDELTGLVALYKDGEWILVEPRLEPGDNLIENGDLCEWGNGDGPFNQQGITANKFMLWNAGNTRNAVVLANNKIYRSFPKSIEFSTNYGGVEIFQISNNNLEGMQKKYNKLCYAFKFFKKILNGDKKCLNFYVNSINKMEKEVVNINIDDKILENQVEIELSTFNTLALYMRLDAKTRIVIDDIGIYLMNAKNIKL